MAGNTYDCDVQFLTQLKEETANLLHDAHEALGE
jgi:hypothetical protein